MAKSKTKSEIIAGIAEATEITKKQAGLALETLVSMAYKGARKRSLFPGLGKLVLASARRALAAIRRPAQPLTFRRRKWSSSA